MQEPVFNKDAIWRPASFLKRDSGTGDFVGFLTEHLLEPTSVFS